MMPSHAKSQAEVDRLYDDHLESLKVYAETTGAEVSEVEVVTTYLKVKGDLREWQEQQPR